MSEYKLTHINVETELQDEVKRRSRRYDYSLNLNIKAAFDLRLDMAGIDLIDLCIFEVIKTMLVSDSFFKVTIPGGGQWVWVAHSKVLDQCPFLDIGKQRLSQRIQKLCDVGLLKKHLDMTSGSRTLYRQGPSFDSMLMGGGTEKITNPSVVSYVGGTEKITDNNIIINNKTNNKEYESGSKDPSSPLPLQEERKSQEGKEKQNKSILLAKPRETTDGTKLFNAFCDAFEALNGIRPQRSGKTSTEAARIVSGYGLNDCIRAIKPFFEDVYAIQRGFPWGLFSQGIASYISKANIFGDGPVRKLSQNEIEYHRAMKRLEEKHEKERRERIN